ncbi:MAG: putative surface protein with fasciclin (FAS1) repeats [Gammaproteobacteria bacterium]|jgi:uncharacterized surface protein with fasciclin (FAS1) repeats
MSSPSSTRRASGFAQVSAFLFLFCLTWASAAADAYTVMRDWGQFATFCRLIERAQLVKIFWKQTSLTVFAPTDRAFARMDKNAFRALELPENRDRLRAVLLYHMVAERISVFDMTREVPRATIHGKSLTSLLMSGQMVLNDAFIDIEDIQTPSGAVHAIDKVLMAPS